MVTAAKSPVERIAPGRDITMVPGVLLPFTSAFRVWAVESPQIRSVDANPAGAADSVILILPVIPILPAADILILLPNLVEPPVALSVIAILPLVAPFSVMLPATPDDPSVSAPVDSDALAEVAEVACDPPPMTNAPDGNDAALVTHVAHAGVAVALVRLMLAGVP